MKTLKCNACGAPMVWVRMKVSGKKNPLDADASPKGNIRILESDTGADAPLAEGVSKSKPAVAGESLYTSHFVTCPEAAEFRKR